MAAAQLSAPTSALVDLALEAAVAARVLRTSGAPAGLLKWLARPASVQPCPEADIQHLCDPRLIAVLDEIIGPLSTRPAKSQQRQTRFAAPWLAVACRYSAKQSSRLQLAIGPRLLAASLLPLYRCLASDDLCEGLRQTQIRLTETLGLLALCDEVGPDLVDVLGGLNTCQASPHAVLADHFNLSLPHLAQLLDEITTDFDFTAGQFSSGARQRLQSFDASQSSLDTPAWATPDLLWKLAGELTSKSSELKLPRSWIDTPLPWNQIADHWYRMLKHLSSPPPPDPISCSGETDLADEASALTTINEIAASIPGDRPTLDTLVAPPKVRISEILSHYDPSFVSVIRRQIGKCRSEDRALSLVSLVVLPEDANHRFAVYDNGLNLWQQKLVGWLSDQPLVVEPHAFLTSDGELLLCILDLERNETTALLRHGLVEVLTGQQFNDSQGNLLAEVDAPARYHAGIASTSSPGARFLPEQLIDPAIRCMSAARRHGKASIKSIEVY